MRAIRILILVVASLTAAGEVGAQAKDPAAADALFRQAREAMKQGDYASAWPKLLESNRLDPAAGTALNLAQCEHRLGKLASALAHYKEAAEQLPTGDPRIKVAREGIASIEARVPRLTLKLPADAPAGTVVTRDDVELGAGSIGTALPVDPGEHVIVTRAPGRKPWRQTLAIQEAESRELTAQIGDKEAASEPVVPETRAVVPPVSPASARPPEPISPVRPGPSGGSLRTVGYVVGAIGVVGLGAGTYFAMKAKSLDDEASSHDHFHSDPSYATGYYCDSVCAQKTADSRDASKLGYVGFVGGGALIAGGLAMILLSPGGGETTNVAVKVSVGPTSLHLGGAW